MKTQVSQYRKRMERLSPTLNGRLKLHIKYSIMGLYSCEAKIAEQRAV